MEVLSLPVFVIFSVLSDYSASIMFLLRLAAGIAYIILIFAIGLVMMFGHGIAQPGKSIKVKTILLMLLVLVFGFGPLIVASYLGSILLVLGASLFSGFS